MQTQSTIDRLSNGDWRFVLQFIVDNNPTAIQANLDSVGLLSIPPHLVTKDDLLDVLFSIDNPELLYEVTQVPYVNEQGNYTGGFDRVLEVSTNDTDTTGSTRAAGVGLVIFQGLTTLTTAFFNWQGQQSQQENLQTQLEIELARQQQIESRKIFGLEPLAFSVLVGALALVIIVIVIKI